jgi:hypothetical protein
MTISRTETGTQAVVEGVAEKAGDKLARIVALLLSLAFFHAFPFLVVTSYMSWEGFFSYDMFKEGASGIKAFYWWTEIVMIVGAIYFCGFFGYLLHLWLARRLKWSRIAGGERFALIVLALVNLLFFFLIWSRDLSNQTLQGFSKADLLLTGLIALWIAIHLGVLASDRGRAALYSLLVGILLLVGVSVVWPAALAFPYTLTLQFFGTGGGLPVTYRTEAMPKSATGRLVLASPDHLYVSQTTRRGMSIVNRSDLVEFEVQNLSGFGHYPVMRER